MSKGSLASAIKVEGGNDSSKSTVDIVDHNATDAGLELAGTLVTATAAELNLLDGGTSVGSGTDIQTSDGFILNDDGTMKLVSANDVKSFVQPTLLGTNYNKIDSGTSSTASIGNHYSFDFTNIDATYTFTLPAIAGGNAGSEIRIFIKTPSTNVDEHFLKITTTGSDEIVDVDSGGSALSELLIDVNSASSVGTTFILLSDGSSQWEVL